MNIVERGKLEAFLKKNRAFAEYKRELRENQGLPYAKHLESINAESAFSSAFSWSSSVKGFKFWVSLHRKYAELVG